jgi:hypothetical protein
MFDCLSRRAASAEARTCSHQCITKRLLCTARQVFSAQHENEWLTVNGMKCIHNTADFYPMGLPGEICPLFLISKPDLYQ